MVPALQQLFSQLETRKMDLLGGLDSLTPEQMNAQPAPDRWSVVMVIQHLVLAERGIRLSEGKSRDDLTAGQVDAGNLFGIVMEALEKDLPVEVPDPGAVPDGDADVDALVRQWDDERAAMRARLDHLDRDDLDALLFSHPVAGPMDPVQTLQLAIAHFDTHARQIDRLRGELAV